MRPVAMAALLVALLSAGCTALPGQSDSTHGNVVYTPPDSFTLSNESRTRVQWRSGATGTTIDLLLVPNPQSGDALIENFGQQWSPSNYIGDWFQARNRSEIRQLSVGGRTWLQANLSGENGLKIAAFLTADDRYLYQFFLAGDRASVDDLYPEFRSTLADAEFSE